MPECSGSERASPLGSFPLHQLTPSLGFASTDMDAMVWQPSILLALQTTALDHPLCGVQPALKDRPCLDLGTFGQEIPGS